MYGLTRIDGFFMLSSLPKTLCAFPYIQIFFKNFYPFTHSSPPPTSGNQFVLCIYEFGFILLLLL